MHTSIRSALAVKPARNPIANSTKYSNACAAWIVPGFSLEGLCKRGHERMGTQVIRDGRRFAGPCFYGPLAYTFSFNSVQLNPRLEDNLKRRSGAFTEDAVHRARPLLVQMRNISDWIRSHRSQLEALAWLISVVGISLVLLLFVFGPKRIAPIEHGTPTSRREFTSKEPCGPISWRRFDKGKSNSQTGFTALRWYSICLDSSSFRNSPATMW